MVSLSRHTLHRFSIVRPRQDFDPLRPPVEIWGLSLSPAMIERNLLLCRSRLVSPVMVLSALASIDGWGTLGYPLGMKRYAVPGMWIDDGQPAA
jgi:hypothetical protein